MAIFLFKADPTQGNDLTSLLSSAGFGTVNFYDSKESFLNALGIAPDSSTSAFYAPVDLFILDGVSELKDFDVIGALRRNYRYQDVPVIAISDSRQPELVQMTFAYGANDFIARPFQNGELVARVRSCLKLKHEIDRRQARERELTEVSKQLAELNDWLAKLSLLDGLTRVSNRRAFDETILQEWKRSVRSRSALTLLLIDVDYFKQYNDSFGHQSGDDCLKAVATSLKSCLNRPADFLARYGGDEFAIVLPDTNLQGARIVAHRIQSEMERRQMPQSPAAPKSCVTVTVGGTSWVPTISDKIQDFIQCSDSGLYRAKSAGRNCVTIVEAPESFPDRAKKTA